mmetsp:Transcript_38667/g.70393  ORF Transcript_38667/g.70393 Transcript_38667/m.70393 type:complete len:818 (+) Transcript_38667:27-2480(+)
MLSTGAAALVGTVATVYTYNLGRFQFDANQAQNSAHQCQNMRLAQWSLFREDVRDLFGLTASNMSTYMVVGTLIVSCAMNFIWNGYKDYPTDPPWLLVIWNNTVFVCITFGLLSVWLAMHGAISSNSACAKILTQAVRPPIPTLQEVAQVRSAQESFEGAGLKAFFQVPVVNAFLKQAFKQMRESARSMLSRQGREARRFSRQYSSGTSRRSGMAVLPRVQAVLSDADGGPGRSAVSSSHFWLLRQVQRSYACFDAYARISLSVSASQLLLVDAYYALGHFMSKSQGWPSPVQNTAAAWLAVGAAIFASIVIFRLDLFVRKRRLQLIHVSIVAGPLVACVATHLSCVRTNFGRGGFKPSEQLVPALLPWALALLSCLLHAWYILVVRSVAEPAGGKDGLPLNFRSAHYLNVFGWHFSSCGMGPGLFTLETQMDLSGPTDFDRGITPDDGGIASCAAEPFEVMAERPDITSKARAMAWKYFSITCLAVSAVWAASVVVILFDPTYRESTIAPSEKYSRFAWKQLNITFPHTYFRPFALGCTPSHRMAIGDHFMIYVTDLPEDIKLLDRVSDTMPVSDFSTSWKGVGIADWITNRSASAASSQPAKHRKRKFEITPPKPPQEVLFILHNDGSTVEERAFGTVSGDGRGELLQNWKISHALQSMVDAIEPVGGEFALPCKSDRRSPYRGWGLMAATERGHVMLLCPSNRSTLEPLHVVASLARRSSAPWVVAGADIHRILGVHVDSHRGILWLMAARGDGVAEVRGWTLATGQLFGNWDLPTGRRWATGICGLGKSGGLLLGASAEFTPAAKPEVWHFTP